VINLIAAILLGNNYEKIHMLASFNHCRKQSDSS